MSAINRRSVGFDWLSITCGIIIKSLNFNGMRRISIEIENIVSQAILQYPMEFI